MEMLPVDLTAVIAVILGMMVVLIPITGLTARFALKPIVEALAKFRETKVDQAETHLLQQRVALLEQQLQGMERSLDQLTEEAEFRRQLESPRT